MPTPRDFQVGDIVTDYYTAEIGSGASTYLITEVAEHGYVNLTSISSGNFLGWFPASAVKLVSKVEPRRKSGFSSFVKEKGL